MHVEVIRVQLPDLDVDLILHPVITYALTLVAVLETLRRLREATR